MELDTCCLPLTLPRVVVGVEDSISEQVVEGGPEILPLGEVCKLGLQEVVQVPGIGCDHAVEATEPRAFEPKRTVLMGNDVG